MNRSFNLTLLLLTFTGCLTSRPKLDTDTITVSRVIDGDSIEVIINNTKTHVRIVGIDAHETRRDERAKKLAAAQGITLDELVAQGKKATAYLARLIEGKKVTLVESYQPAKLDGHKRKLCYVEIGGRDVGEQMLNAGHAWKYETFPHPRLERYRNGRK